MKNIYNLDGSDRKIVRNNQKKVNIKIYNRKFFYYFYKYVIWFQKIEYYVFSFSQVRKYYFCVFLFMCVYEYNFKLVIFILDFFKNIFSLFIFLYWFYYYSFIFCFVKKFFVGIMIVVYSIIESFGYFYEFLFKNLLL